MGRRDRLRPKKEVGSIGCHSRSLKYLKSGLRKNKVLSNPEEAPNPLATISTPPEGEGAGETAGGLRIRSPKANPDRQAQQG